jgi:hypothetical protein
MLGPMGGLAMAVTIAPISTYFFPYLAYLAAYPFSFFLSSRFSLNLWLISSVC